MLLKAQAPMWLSHVSPAHPAACGRQPFRGDTNNTMQNLKRRQFYMQNQAVQQWPNNYLCANTLIAATARTDDPNTGQI
jgi:hypothetical protein